MTAALRTASWLVGTLGLALVVGGCTAGTSTVEACVEHSVEEGVARTAAETACREVRAPD